MKKCFFVLAAVCLLAACGNKDKGDTQALDEQDMLLEQALESGDFESASMLADSLALNVDDLSPQEAVGVLAAFVKIQEKAEKDGQRRKSLETMRKFVDVYDIAFALDSDGMRSAVERLRSRPGMPDLAALFVTYRDKLNNNVTAVEEDVAAPKDSVAADSVASAPTATVAPETETDDSDIDYYD